ncbi:hypothetical protein DOT_2059, partial [Desulfosporosinus sp. OT]
CGLWEYQLLKTEYFKTLLRTLLNPNGKQDLNLHHMDSDQNGVLRMPLLTYSPSYQQGALGNGFLKVTLKGALITLAINI